MKFGVRAHDYGRYTARQLAEILKKEEFQAIQLAVPKAVDGMNSYGSLTEAQLGEIRQAFEQVEIEISVLGCYIDLSSRDRQMRERQMEEFCRAMECCRFLGAGMVGTESSYGIIPMEEKKQTWNLVADGVLRIVEQAEKIGVDVGIEPVAAHTLYSPEWTRKLLDQVGSPRLNVIFDPVNLLTPESVSDQERLWKSCFELFGKEIAAVHLKDFQMDENGTFIPCQLGTGLMEYEDIFSWLHQEKPDISILREEMVVEKSHLDIAYMKELLKE